MSDFVSSILAASALDVERLRAVLDSHLPARVGFAQSASLTSMSSATPANLDSPGVSVTGVTADELLFFLFSHTCSCGTAIDVVGSRSFFDAADAANRAYSNGIASSSAVVATQTTFARALALTGTVQLIQKIWRDSGSGTVYSANRNYLGIQFKKRS